MLGSVCPRHVLCLGTFLNIPNILTSQREVPFLGQAPGWPRSSPDILPGIWEWKLKAVPSSSLGPGVGVWLPPWSSGASPFLPGLSGPLCRRYSSPMICSGKDWRGEIFPPASVLFGSQGKWEELLLSVQRSQWELPAKLLLSCRLQADSRLIS